jgi:6-methylsalicylic acid synthase
MSRSEPPRAAPAPRPPEPIAVIGLACRFPGAGTVDEFWSVLQRDTSTVGPVPPSRWRWEDTGYQYPHQSGTRRLQRGSFIEDLEFFDADFFGLPPGEAERLDPQHRLALEVAWEALESACIRPRDLAGSFTGVIMGVSHSDHAVKILNDHAGYDGKEGLLAYECFVSNRVSHALDLKGPSYAVNSACASSLHALHAACQSLRSGECDLVLSGGVNVDVTVDEIVSSAMAGWIAEDAECRSFQEGGSGFVTGDGCGVVVLKRLEDALRDGDRVWGVLRDSVLGHNGMSSRISWPSGNAQRDVLRRLLARNGLAPADIDAIEAHGTGGAMSDRIEASAFTDVLGAGRDAATALRVGCCKAHVGHLEAASGVAGLVKMLMALQHESLPALRDFTAPNPAIRPHAGVRFLARAEAWPRGERPRRAIVSNFSFGGANAVLLLEEAPPGVGPFDRPASGVADGAPDDDTGLRLLALRAKTDGGLAAMQARLVDHLDARGRPLDDDEVHTLNVHRADLRQRVLLAGRGLPALDAALRAPDDDAPALRTSSFPAAWRDASPVLRLDGPLFGAAAGDALARLRRGRLGGRLWAAWAAEFDRLPLDALLDDPARRARLLAAFWVRSVARLGVPVKAVMADLDLAPVVPLAWQPGDRAALMRWILEGRVDAAGDADVAGALDAAAPADADLTAPPQPPVIAPVADAALPTWSLTTSRPSVVFGPMPTAWLARGDAPALGLDDTPSGHDRGDADDALARLLGGLFCLGVDLRWSALSDGAKRPVPAAPFDRRHAWFRPAPRREALTPPATSTALSAETES